MSGRCWFGLLALLLLSGMYCYRLYYAKPEQPTLSQRIEQRAEMIYKIQHFSAPRTMNYLKQREE